MRWQRMRVAMMGGKALGVLDLRTKEMKLVPLGGAAVQAGVTPDNKVALASLYDTKRLALYFPDSDRLEFVPLPAAAKGPVQMYPAPDGRHVYLTDQGYYFDQPTSEWVYRVDLATRRVAAEIKVGQAPHGIVVSDDGDFAYTTNLAGGDVSVIDTAAGQEVARIPVGKAPNGISLWSSASGGTP